MMQDLLNVKNLNIGFTNLSKTKTVVNGISFEVKKGRTLALVGESGCGKSITSLSLMRLVDSKAAKINAEKIDFDGKDILSLSEKNMRLVRGKDIAMIFQEPMTSLNPVFTVGAQIEEVLKAHTSLTAAERKEKVISLLNQVHMPEPRERYKSYPHELSGGQRQRVMIAMAVACSPKLLIADEPTTALDVTIQAQIINLLIELKEQSQMSMIFITHNLSIVRQIADDVVVMYAGNVMERAASEAVIGKPLHPYTKGLLASVPSLDIDRSEKLKTIKGSLSADVNDSAGCVFADRCDYAKDICTQEKPKLEEVLENHYCACHFAKEIV